MVATISFNGTISGGSVTGRLTYNSTVDFRAMDSQRPGDV